MSLINEALKKAQRLRHEQQAGASAEGPAATSGIRKRGRPLSAQSLLILVAGASVLIVFSVVITVYLLNQEPPSPPAPAAANKPVPVVDTSAPSPVIVAPVIANQATQATPPPAPPSSTSGNTTPAVSLPAPKEPVVAVAPITESPVATATPAAPVTSEAPRPAPPIEPAAPKADPRIQDFVDAVRVTGIRSSGTDSKVLMNDRVYKVNDIVDRSLGVKLVSVAPDALVFADANGFTYTKNF